jgi:hypothetical protein
MDTATELKNTSDIVKLILQKYPATRNSDDLLYMKVCEYVNGTHISLPFWKVMQERKDFGYPPFESVRRSRQKLQATYPELSANKVVEAQREENEKAYKEFARGVI